MNAGNALVSDINTKAKSWIYWLVVQRLGRGSDKAEMVVQFHSGQPILMEKSMDNCIIEILFGIAAIGWGGLFITMLYLTAKFRDATKRFEYYTRNRLEDKE